LTSIAARTRAPCRRRTRLWPLYGAGFENLGKPTAELRWTCPLPQPGPDEVLVRHDAVGICFSDIKVIRAGENHPRIHRSMRADPVVLGHEVALTVDRCGRKPARAIQVPATASSCRRTSTSPARPYAYGYEIAGRLLSLQRDRLARAGRRPRQLPDPDQATTTATPRPALCEPWACVEASYTVSYRTTWQPGGVVWLVGDGAGVELGAAAAWRPARVVLDVRDEAVCRRGARLGAADRRDRHRRRRWRTRYDDIVVRWAMTPT
jgi:threonine dehydrogenase-like Zn-dependent dehydrogenase